MIDQYLGSVRALLNRALIDAISDFNDGAIVPILAFGRHHFFTFKIELR